jgi:hypothetical protein
MQATLEAPRPAVAQTTEKVRVVSIGAIADYYGVSAESLRNWERAGLIPEARRTPGGHRRYTKEHVLAIHKLLTGPDGERRS